MVKTSISNEQKGVWNEDEDGERRTHCSRRSRKRRWSKKPAPKLKTRFTPQEEELIIRLHAAVGSRWSIIALKIPGKTENDVKILWNSKLKKKLYAMGIDPVTHKHKPFPQNHQFLLARPQRNRRRPARFDD